MKWIGDHDTALKIDLETLLELAEQTMGQRSGDDLYNYCLLWRTHHDANIRYILKYIDQQRSFFNKIFI